MRTLVVGDLHLKESRVLPRVERARVREGAGRVVLCGDYSDDWGASGRTELSELEFLAAWAEERRLAGTEVSLVVGNHDFAYLRAMQGPGTCAEVLPQVCELLRGIAPTLATTVGDVLVCHAGLTTRWARAHLADALREAGDAASTDPACPAGAAPCQADDRPAGEEGAASPAESRAARLCRALNDLYADPASWGDLDSAGPARGGWGLPGPLWADASELVANPLPGLRQVVGHTPQLTCTRISQRPEIWACDTFSTYRDGAPIGDGSCLLIDDEGVVRRVDVMEGAW